MRKLHMPKESGAKTLIEGHPLGIQKIIKGDLREVSWVVDGVTYTHQNTSGLLLWDRKDERDRPYFVLVLDTRESNGD